jgi:hypothetical protein
VSNTVELNPPLVAASKSVCDCDDPVSLIVPVPFDWIEYVPVCVLVVAGSYTTWPSFTLTTWHELFHVTDMVFALADEFSDPMLVRETLRLPLPSKVTVPKSTCEPAVEPFAV